MGNVKGMFAIMRGLNKAYDIEESRKFITRNLVALISTIGVIAMILIALIMIVFGNIIGIYIFSLVGALDLFNIVWSILRYCIPAVLMFFTFTLLYRYVPNKN